MGGREKFRLDINYQAILDYMKEKILTYEDFYREEGISPVTMNTIRKTGCIQSKRIYKKLKEKKIKGLFNSNIINNF